MAESYATRDLKLQDDSAHGAVTASGQMESEEQPFVLTPARRAHCMLALRSCKPLGLQPSFTRYCARDCLHIMNRTPLVVATQTGPHWIGLDCRDRQRREY